MSTAEDFDQFYRQHRKRLDGYLRSLGVAPEIIDEVVPRAFMVLRRHWVRVHACGKAYLFKVARNEASRLAKDGYLPQPCISIEAVAADGLGFPDEVEGFADRLADRELIERLLDQLPSRQRETLTLRYFEGFSVKEAAGIMKVSEGTVKSCTSDAIAKLKTLVARMGNQDRRA